MTRTPPHTGEVLADMEKEKLLRAYASGDMAWSTLREKGFHSYVDVLAGLGRLGLRPPVATLEGPNAASRERGRAYIRAALKARP